VKKIEAIIRPDRLATVSASLEQKGFHGFTIADVRGHGQSPERVGEWRGQTYEVHVTHKLELTVIVEDQEVTDCVAAIVAGARTGNLGDGLIAVSDLTTVYQIRTGTPVAAGPLT
jgi:nitrogen regulatory protein P-II 1